MNYATTTLDGSYEVGIGNAVAFWKKVEPGFYGECISVNIVKEKDFNEKLVNGIFSQRELQSIYDCLGHILDCVS